jgi:hypothetical protein
MGLLKAAIFQGASQGLNVLGQGMMRDIAQGQEQSIWEKRQALLAQIQRENAQNIREDDLNFRETNAPRARAIQAGDIAAQGEAQTAAEVARLQNPGMLAAKDAEAAAQTERELKRLEALSTDPRATAAQKREAEARAAALREEVTIRGDGAIRVANATRGPGAKSVSDQIAEDEKLLGRKLTQDELMAKLGYGKKEGKPDATFTEATKAVFQRYQNGEITAEQTGSELTRIQASVQGAPMAEVRKREVAQARSTGKIAEAVAELRSMGYGDEQMMQLGITKDELASAVKKQAAARASEGPAERAGQPVQLLQPLYDFNAMRKRMQQEANDRTSAQGFNPSGR